jgi:hypothetical protein
VSRHISGGLACVTCVFAVMWLCSYSYYTSLGIDLEQARGPRILCTFYRLRWPGDGSLRVGTVVMTRPGAVRLVDPFDLGGAFFQPARRETPRSLWNRLGFWWIAETREQAGEPPTQEFWVGLPSWLPSVVGGAATLWMARESRSVSKR